MGGTESKWTDAYLDRMRSVGDAVADGPVAAVLDRGGVDAVNAIMRTLVRVDQPVPTELPDELEEYLAQTLSLPEWADWNKIRRGQKVFERWGIYIALCLYCASLPSSYAAAKGVQVLHLTARLDTDPQRRILETGQFLFDVLSVGGLDENGKGRRTIQRVRLMHAAVRHLIKARAETTPAIWDPEWGVPVNQEDLAGTLLAFSYVVGDPMRRLGIELSHRDIDAYLHLWNVIGHQMGLDENLMAQDASEAADLIDIIRRRQFRSCPEGRQLTASLTRLLDEMTPGYVFDDTIPPLIRTLIGDETADLLAISPSDGFDELGWLSRTADWFLVRGLGRRGRTLFRYHAMAHLARPFGVDLLRNLYGLERGGERAPFDIPDRLPPIRRSRPRGRH